MSNVNNFKHYPKLEIIIFSYERRRVSSRAECFSFKKNPTKKMALLEGPGRSG